MQSRQIHFANSAISVEYEGEVPSHLVDFLFHYVPDKGPVEPHIYYRLSKDAAKDELVLLLEDKRETRMASSSTLWRKRHWFGNENL